MTSAHKLISKNREQSGFSLVEIMVGLAIGLLSSIIIMQVISAFEVQRLSTSGTADAQTNGNIALYNISREIQQAGFPLMPIADSALECTTLAVSGVNATIDTITPVSISSVGASDTLTIHYGTSTSGGIPTKITGIPTGNAAPVVNNFGCVAGDTTLITSGTNCFMSAVATSGVVGTTTLNLINTAGVTNTAQIACLGSWNEVIYSVDEAQGILQSATNGNAAIPIVEGIVNLQAQYGISATPASNTITAWVNPESTSWAAFPLSTANRNRIKAVRIAVVARNPKKIAGACTTTTACTSLDSANPTGLCAWEGDTNSPAPQIDLSGSDADWGCYRYRVFESIIPIRNVIWSGGTGGTGGTL